MFRASEGPYVGIWPVLMTVGLLLGSVAAVWVRGWADNGGMLVYALDDAYIHMAIAENLVQHKVWGVTAHGFTSSASSLLWPLLLSATFLLTDCHVVVPIVLNVLAALALVLLTDAVCARRFPNTIRFVILLGVVQLTPIVPLIFAGMEHVLHAVLSISLCVCGSAIVADKEEPSRHDIAMCSLLAMLLAATRYEGLFLVGPLALFLLLRRRYTAAFCIASGAALPVVVYGVISYGCGWMPLPNSVLLKSVHPSVSSMERIRHFLTVGVYRAVENKHLLWLLIFNGGVVLVHGRKAGLRKKQCVLSWLILIAALMHLQLARVGWFYRYEAYIVALGLVGVASFAAEMISSGDWRWRPTEVAIGATALVFVCSLGARSFRAFEETPKAMSDRFYEHILPARFLKRNYEGATVVANDIGALAFYTNCRILDIYGLASMEPVRFRLQKGGYKAADVASWAARENARIGIFQIEWREVMGRVPNQWKKVGEWEIPRNVVFADRKIGFYAIDPLESRALIDRLRAFSDEVPKCVTQSGLYMQERDAE